MAGSTRLTTLLRAKIVEALLKRRADTAERQRARQTA